MMVVEKKFKDIVKVVTCVLSYSKSHKTSSFMITKEGFCYILVDAVFKVFCKFLCAYREAA